MFGASLMANVIWPALATPYLLPLAISWVGIIISFAAELIVMLASRRITAKPLVITGLVTAANFVSWCIGAVVTSVLPSGLIKGESVPVLTPGPLFLWLALIGLVVYYPITVLFEGGFYHLVRRHLPVARFWQTIALANGVSYGVLLISLMIGWMLRS